MTCIVGIDPGHTTGFCMVDEKPKAGIDDFQVVSVAQIPWEKRVSFFIALFNGTFANNKGESQLPEIVVIESFRLRPGRAMEQVGSEFPSVRVIGIVEALTALCLPERPLLVFQEPGVIGRVGILPKHEEQLRGLVHAGDAYRHVRYYHLTTGRRG